MPFQSAQQNSEAFLDHLIQRLGTRYERCLQAEVHVEEEGGSEQRHMQGVGALLAVYSRESCLDTPLTLH